MRLFKGGLPAARKLPWERGRPVRICRSRQYAETGGTPALPGTPIFAKTEDPDLAPAHQHLTCGLLT